MLTHIVRPHKMGVLKRFGLLLTAIFCVFFAETKADSSLAAETSDTVSIWCLTPPDTTVFWQYQREVTSSDVFLCMNGNIIDQYKNRFKISSPFRGYFLMTIYNVTVDDAGIYFCTGNDGLDQVKQHTRIVVRGRHTHLNETAAVGSSVQIQCRTTVQLRTKWIYRRHETEPETQLTTETHVLQQFNRKFSLSGVSRGDYTLAISSVQLNDTGLYTCIEGGTSSHTVHLSVVNPDVNECLSNPCTNGGACVDGINKYTCHCSAGFTGMNCDIDIDECQSNPCLNDGLCLDKIGKYTCRCLPDFTGENCEHEDKKALSTVAVAAIVAVVTLLVVGLTALIVFVFLRNRRKRSTVAAKAEIRPLMSRQHSAVFPVDNCEPATATCLLGKASELERLARTWINGITVYDNYIIALRGRQLQFYERSTHAMQRTVTFPQVYKHFRNDLVLRQANDHKHHLYITDYFNRNVYKIALPLIEDTVQAEAEWTVEFQPSGVSVTLDQNILVTCLDARKLIEFSPDGRQILAKISLISEVEWPLHAVEIHSESAERRFAVCHSGDVVKIVDRAGKTVWSYYGHETNSGPNMPYDPLLASPCHIAVDWEKSSIYVADEFNDRVVSLSFELKCEFEFVCQEVHRPRRLLLHDKRLYIGQFNGHLKYVDTQLVKSSSSN